MHSNAINLNLKIYSQSESSSKSSKSFFDSSSTWKTETLLFLKYTSLPTVCWFTTFDSFVISDVCIGTTGGARSITESSLFNSKLDSFFFSTISPTSFAYAGLFSTWVETSDSSFCLIYIN